ncbi:thioredoxin family protein, partial [Chloroflexota bacterium]
TIKIFGTSPPCSKCKELTKRVVKVSERYPGKIEVTHFDALTDEGNKYSIIMTPTLVVNNKVVSIANVPSEDDIEKMIKNQIGGNI